MLLFTAPSKNWDWCLYETGLYTRFDRTEVALGRLPVQPRTGLAEPARRPAGRACRHRQGPRLPGHALPRDVEDLGRLAPGAAGARDRGRNRWRPRLAPSPRRSAVRGRPRRTTRAIAWCCRCPSPTTSQRDPRERAGDGRAKRHLGVHDVVVRPGRRHRQADVGRSVASRRRDRRRTWRRELDSHFLQALGEKLFPPIEGRMRAGGTSRGSATALPSDHLQHRSRAGGRAGIERCRREPTGGPAP